MTDWKAVAQARQLPLTPEQAERTQTVLAQLEAEFARLKQGLTGGDQPAAIFLPLEGE